MIKKIKIEWLRCPEARWWSMSADGLCWFSIHKPTLDEDQGIWWCPDEPKLDRQITDHELRRHWKESLIEAPKYITVLQIENDVLINDD